MRCGRCVMVMASLAILRAAPVFAEAPSYPWLREYDPNQSILQRIPAPDGYVRADAVQGSFEDWLRRLPLKKGRPEVLLYNGSPKKRQDVHFAIVDIDIGRQNLQQCADAVIRLRAEFLFSTGNRSAIHFNFTSGDRADFSKWAKGDRPVIKGSKVRWVKSDREDASYQGFRKYLDAVFMYAGSSSLSKELHPVQDLGRMRIGDVFVQGGFPGHAVLVVDMAVHGATGRKVFLLAQSYMPAQDIHILRNPASSAPDPWYEADFGHELRTPEWTFGRGDLKRF